ncbi:MAG: CoA transferase [Betaproteobacteria bacterium]|nr:CoA transferase [Betaproteobacteria bacterium]
MPGPLSGIRILDMTSILMGPLATQMLGDMGADVIKVEPPGGDLFRHVTPQRHQGMSHAYLNANRNKRSVVIDAKLPAGRAAILKLAQTADVLVSNIRPSGMKRLGLDYEAVRLSSPRIIYCGCYGYSESGPFAGRSAVDDTIQAACGAASLQGVNTPSPRFVNFGLADKTVSLYIANAITLALFARERTGVGQLVEVPMYECMTSFMLHEHLAGLTFDPALGEAGYARMLTPFRRPFRTKDGYLSVVPYSDRQWRRFFELSGSPALREDNRFRTLTDRTLHISALYKLLEETIAERTTAEWSALLNGGDIPFSPVNSVEDLIEDPHLNTTGFWKTVDHPTEGKLRMTGIPIRFSKTPGSIRRHAPALGEHTDEILDEIRREHGDTS